MDNSLAQSRCALVTGGASGIGAATTQLLRAAGHRVVVLDQAAGDGPDELCVDLADAEATRTAVIEAARRCGRLDALVLAAGTKVRGTVPELDLEQWDRSFAVNVRALFVCVSAALPALRRSDHPGIVTVGSASAHGEAGALAYAATKGAVLSFTRALALDLLADRIRVSSVLPGFVDTPMAVSLSDDQRAAKAAENVAGRLVGPDDVARAIAFLLSDDAATVSGAVLDVGHVSGAFAAPPRVSSAQKGR